MPEASGTNAFLAQLEALSQKYAKKLPATVSKIEAETTEFIEGTLSEERINELIIEIHKMAGSGTTFGFASLSLLARELEILMQDAAKLPGKPPAEVAVEIRKFAGELRKHIGDPVLKHTGKAAEEPDKPKSEVGRLVYIVDDNADEAASIELQLQNFGYNTRIITSHQELDKIIEEQAPDAIIMDIVSPDGPNSGIEAAKRIRKNNHTEIPLVFLSVRSDFEARYKSVLAGGNSYFVKPPNYSELIDKLDNLLLTRDTEPYRVLMVDDDEMLLEHHQKTLEAHGIQPRILLDPTKILEDLSEFKPDVILMDLYLSDYLGSDIARMLEQHMNYFNVPVVYISTETSITRQINALSTSGEAFLTKPVEPEDLIRVVRFRCQRSRFMRSLMNQDSLTGLWNHASIKDRVQQELELIRRQPADLSVAMLDVDYFKKVNDNYGHLSGDSVLKTLAHLLRDRLRSTDVIGRYGGEEFLIAMPNTNVNEARGVLDLIRQDYEKVCHLSADKEEFYSTFSCGIAGAEGKTGAEDLIDAADQALYRAKDGGRNQVLIEGS